MKRLKIGDRVWILGLGKLGTVRRVVSVSKGGLYAVQPEGAPMAITYAGKDLDALPAERNQDDGD